MKLSASVLDFLRHVGTPLRYGVFRRIWLASLLYNLGLMIQTVGAAWAMTQMTSSADMVALVQTAWMLPTMLLSLAAGAVADMYDRRRVTLVALGIGLFGASSLVTLEFFGAVTPWLLLLFCFVIGSSIALFSPAWQASVTEQVPADALAPAIALNSISFNTARSVGPALGGVIVAAAGSVAAFVTNVVLFLPLLAVLLMWRRVHVPSRLPPEGLGKAMNSGWRYILHSPPIRISITRCAIFGLAGGSLAALLPLIARDTLGGSAQTYGLLLGAFGAGAVIGAFSVPAMQRRFKSELAIRACTLMIGAAIVAVSLSRSTALTTLALIVAGSGWTTTLGLFNISVQFSAPRWVAGRALAFFQTAVAGGAAIGSWGWGHLANDIGVDQAVMVSGVTMLVSALLGFWLRMPDVIRTGFDPAEALADPEVRMPLTSRSGPIVIEIEYRVAPPKAREFYGLMLQVQRSRQRNGAYGWSISRDIADDELWTERYHCPTWLDYLRMRSRSTIADRALYSKVDGFHLGPEPVHVHRMLERPFGSVRWKEDTPDRATDLIAEVGPGAGPGAGPGTS